MSKLKHREKQVQKGEKETNGIVKKLNIHVNWSLIKSGL